QAEDGIRVLTVTGVQTCALPILKQKDSSGGQHPSRSGSRPRRGHSRRSPTPRHAATRSVSRAFTSSSPAPGRRVGQPSSSSQPRSEERRVGKECVPARPPPPEYK